MHAIGECDRTEAPPKHVPAQLKHEITAGLQEVRSPHNRTVRTHAVQMTAVTASGVRTSGDRRSGVRASGDRRSGVRKPHAYAKVRSVDEIVPYANTRTTACELPLPRANSTTAQRTSAPRLFQTSPPAGTT